MWRPATKAVSGTNDVPLTNQRRFGLPQDAPPPPPPAAGGAGAYGKPPQDMQFFNGLRRNEPAPPPPPQQSSQPPRDAYERERPRDDYDHRPRDDYRRDDRDRGGDRDRHDRDRYDRGGDRGGYDRYDRDRERDGRERDMGRDRERTRERRWDDVKPEVKDEPPADGEPKKRKSRWGDASQKVEVPGLPVTVMGNVTQRELDSYAVHVRLEEINRKLRTGDVIPPPGQRSPSPPPEYDNFGRRTNTLDVRYKKKLEDERTRLIDRAMKADPNFRPPVDMMYGRRNQRPQDKVYIPVKEFPEINFFGLLVGPRGNSLKRMERESGAKISIRGKGSVKEGKGRDGKFAEDEEDELHCLIMADDPQKVKDCVDLINRVIETAASTPEGQNDHKRNQLRELASLNGTLRDDENQACQNCGEIGHRRFECPQQRVYSANVICRLCGGAGHMARDCRGRGDPNLAQNKATQFDSEYSALMAELGEGGGAGGQGPSAVPQGALNAPPPQQRVPPWRIPENWFSNFRPGPAAPHQGYGQQHQNQGYGYGAYQPGADMQQGGGPGGPGGAPGGGAQDPYAAYYASMGQTA